MSDLDRLRAAVGARYTIEKAVGAGGMATVYLARDARHRRRVAEYATDGKFIYTTIADRQSDVFVAELSRRQRGTMTLRLLALLALSVPTVVLAQEKPRPEIG